MLSNAGLQDHCHFWIEADSIACYLVNCSLHSSIDFEIIEGVQSGNSVDYSILEIFRCLVYAYVNNAKLASRIIQCMFLGYTSESKEFSL